MLETTHDGTEAHTHKREKQQTVSPVSFQTVFILSLVAI